MGTVVHVPQTRDMIGEELSGDEALTALRHYGGRRLLLDAFARFRYADGFSHSRSLAFQVVLGLVPFTIALVGVATTVHTESVGRIIERTVGRIVPGASASLVEDALDATARSAGSGVWNAVAMWLGLAFALLNLASAMGQVERGANRIYGVERDRPFLAKYGRALLLALAAGMPMVLGFLVLVAGDAVGTAVVETLDWSRDWLDLWGPLEVPLGVLLAWVASAVIFRWAPRRDQPGYTWLAFGSAVHLVLWVTATWLLALYVARSGSFGAVYGPLTAFVALLLWANLTGVALFLGIAFAAQLEAARAGITEAVRPDPGPGP
ncbi:MULTISPECIES: YihY/virulence factor BrkB family protein [Streptomyces]|uniref:YihY/virulence factor BrkB family protein n=1 Tax=Streptomyces caniscabiei TaxID=2746961 RepID=A0ABU4MVK0_9ACTN|nr:MULTISPECIES: YihY/virulence factor BrkB family protein [Streptomyces]MBE4734624.1 YihY/virulence factor BrkB family protein [Streptomyces caniscabiei]MBE4755495.1 YihY/virulence factor BrkB family protein [Streptomyces caniscabiei]MBE4772381.1 YihY/virulence factor BrkB family protein [Streptomyces caniscabiei]MBE4783221.1 YihY/virulence factor BrkB family protein [Streptomyces caniscabiei]MBE4792525.1 YihY/virulence factor BrkB family protein [Streptomyces caniscabiei]